MENPRVNVVGSVIGAHQGSYAPRGINNQSLSNERTRAPELSRCAWPRNNERPRDGFSAAWRELGGGTFPADPLTTSLGTRARKDEYRCYKVVLSTVATRRRVLLFPKAVWISTRAPPVAASWPTSSSRMINTRRPPTTRWLSRARPRSRRSGDSVGATFCAH